MQKYLYIYIYINRKITFNRIKQIKLNEKIIQIARKSVV